jgi:hypothetical protein
MKIWGFAFLSCGDPFSITEVLLRVVMARGWGGPLKL